MYVAIAIVWTWPLALGLARDVPGGFGDPLLNSWILAWDATHAGRGWWNANIFYPQSLALAYSEHLAPQALAIAPVYALTKNPILCYNLTLLSTFVLSGLGMYLLARELTGRHEAALVAGLAFAFAPYRVGALPHVQVLSSQWMPFALFGFRRYFETGRVRALAGGTAAWTLQNLSSGYYLLFFSPVVALYLAWEIATRRGIVTSRTMWSIAAACAAATLVMLPFALPYAELRGAGFGPRAVADVQRYAADVYAYFTADPKSLVWGSLARAFVKQEGALFPGLTVTVLAGIAIARGAGARGLQPSDRREPNRLALQAAFFASVAALIVLLAGWSVRLPFVKITSVARTSFAVAAFGALLLIASREARSWFRSPVAIFTIVTLFAMLMSFGPEIQARGRHVATSVAYTFFYEYVPGADGLRVPARFGMIVALGLATLAAFAIRGRRGAWIAGLLIVLESLAIPLPLNENDTTYARSHLAPLPDRVSPDDFDALHRFVATLPPSTVLVELPLGEPAFDVRYMFYSTRHWKRLVNGYSGGAPEAYGRLDQLLQDVRSRPEPAWQAMIATGATYAIVHEGFYSGDQGHIVSTWLQAHGAREASSFGSDRVLVLRSADAR